MDLYHHSLVRATVNNQAILLSKSQFQTAVDFGKIFRNFALRLLSVAFGSILYYLVLQTVIWLGIDTDLLKMLSALVVAVFLAVPYWKAKYFAKPTKRGGNN